MDTLRVIDIIEGTTVDGPGLRTSIYFAGCSHHCPGCHNAHTWDFESGSEMPITSFTDIIDEAGFNVTFSGGDPLLQHNIEALAKLASHIKETGKTLWCYTGFRYEQLEKMPNLKLLLEHIDVLVDGAFEQDKRDINLLFRGSSNQRLINLNATRNSHKIILWEDTACQHAK